MEWEKYGTDCDCGDGSGWAWCGWIRNLVKLADPGAKHDDQQGDFQ
jgi:hypothetical protein